MTFMQHLQSSLILGTKMAHPEEEHFLRRQNQELFDCINYDKRNELKQLIEAGVDPDRCEQAHIRALSHAINKQKIDIVQILVSYGSDINYSNCFGYKPLDYALETKNEEIIQLLLRYGATDSHGNYPVSQLDFQVADVFEAALTGNLHALVHYHHLGASLNTLSSNRTSLLHLCVEGNNPKLLVYLLNKGLNIDQADRSGTSALLLAAMDSSRLEMLKILLKRNATLDQRNNRHTSPLTMAIKRYNIKAAILLIKEGADVNIRDGIDTPLTLTHKALVQTINKDLLKQLRALETLLITKGAHVNNSDDTLRWSPLMLTASHYQDAKSMQHLKLLIELGANIEQADKNKRTALMISASLGRIEALEYLIKSKAKLDSCDKFGWTALMLSVYYNQKEVVKMLLASGANVNLITKKGLSAIKVAIDNDRASLIPILREYGAVFPKE